MAGEGKQQLQSGGGHKKDRSKNKLRKNGLAFLKVVLRQSLATTFGQHIISTLTAIYPQASASPLEHSTHSNRTGSTTNIAFDMTVPAGLCRTPHTTVNTNSDINKPTLATSAILAIFDELSTLGLMYHDLNHRPGVSVHLSTDSIAPIHANESIYIHCHTDKIGKMLAFCTIEVFNEARNQVLARGKHIKFMPMGSFWDFFTTSWMLPLFLWLFQFFKGKKWTHVSVDHLFANQDDNKKTDAVVKKESTSLKEEVGQVYKKMNLVPVLNPAKELAEILSLQESDPNEETSSYYRFKVRSDLKNGGGGLHGGAIACIIEECCALSRQHIFRDHPMAQSIAIQRMDIRYLSPGKVCFSYFFITAHSLTCEILHYLG